MELGSNQGPSLPPSSPHLSSFFLEKPPDSSWPETYAVFCMVNTLGLYLGDREQRSAESWCLERRIITYSKSGLLCGPCEHMKL